ncbi:MAG TPA: AsmA family protein, partial [Bacteroidales bacterium]|nr:AsmA family protein [Bacteroidales bacterium]
MWKRRLYRVLILVFVVLLRIILSNFALLQSVDYQSYLLKHAIRFMAERYEINLSVGDLELKFPNRIILEDVYLEDVKQDTLLQTNKIEARVSAIKLRKKRLYISSVVLDKPTIFVERDSTGTFNFQYILDKFDSDKQKEPSSEKLDVFVEEFAFKDADISYKDAPWETTPGYFNSSDLFVNGFDVFVSDFQMHGDTIELDLNNLAFQEKSGFGIQKLNARVFVSDSLYQLKNFFLKTNHSLLHAPKFEVAMLNDSIADVWNDINVDMHIDSSLLSLKDAAYFSSDLKGLHQELRLSAKLQGKLSNIKLRDFNFAYGYDTRLIGDVSINGLPEPKNSFVFAEVKRLSSSVRDAESLYLPPFDQQNPVQVPDILHEVGIVNFEGTLTGMFNDLVANGLFQTNAGNISTDVAVKSYGGEGDVKFEGKVNVMNLELGSLLDKKDMLGTLDMNANLRGTLDTLGRYDISLGSKIGKAEVYDYPYSNIEIAGHLTNTSFNGELMINDPNFSFEFIGGYEMENGVPDMDFRADFSANPYELNLDTVKSRVGFLMFANFVGDGINTASGNLQFANMYLKRHNDSVIINKLDINTGKILDEQFIDIKSDYFDFESQGHYDIPKLVSELTGLIYNYFPALSKEDKDWLAAKPGRLRFNARLHDLDEVTSYFMPALQVEDDIELYGVLDASANEYSLNCTTSEI